MQSTTKNRIIIKHHRLDKKKAKKNMHEFPNKPWSASELDKFIKKIDDRGSTDRTNGSGRPKSLIQKIGHQTALN